MFSRDFVIRQIDLELSYGIKDFEITGGEPSECEDLRYYCEYIKKRSPQSKIAIITNGGLWKSNVWGLIDEVLISYHLSKDYKEYSKEMFPLGSTFEKVMETVEKARKNNVLIRTNTVIGSFNYKCIDLIVDDIVKYIKPEIINFLPVNLFDEAEKYGMERYIDYDKVRNIIKREIDFLKIQLPNTLVFVRYIPFCDMIGYEEYIVGTLQHIYDFFDWNVELSGCNMIDLLNKYKTNGEILSYLGKYSSRSVEMAQVSIKDGYEKTNDCLKCRYYMICDGVESTKTHNLIKYIKPTPGKMIRNYLEFLKNKTENKYKEIYG